MNRHTPITSIKKAKMGDTLNAMRAAALKGRKDLSVRRLVEQINEGVAEGDYASETLAIYYWVKQNIRYMRDPDGVEFVKEPHQILKTRAGDCDDLATLLAAMLMAAGNPVNFAIVSFRRGKQPSFSHVYVEVKTPHGPIVIDPVANRDTQKMLKEIQHKAIFPVSQGPGMSDAGIGGALGQAQHIAPKGGKLYSVYDYNRGLYDYYEGSMGTIPATGRYRKPAGMTSFGATPESIAVPLPIGAKKIGEGEAPRGMIASKTTSVLQMPDKRTIITLAAGAAVGVWAYRRWAK